MRVSGHTDAQDKMMTLTHLLAVSLASAPHLPVHTIRQIHTHTHSILEKGVGKSLMHR